jgi:hypothetical protein
MSRAREALGGTADDHHGAAALGRDGGRDGTDGEVEELAVAPGPDDHQVGAA